MDIVRCSRAEGSWALPGSCGIVLEAQEMLNEARGHSIGRRPRRATSSSGDFAEQGRYCVSLGLGIRNLMGNEGKRRSPGKDRPLHS